MLCISLYTTQKNNTVVSIKIAIFGKLKKICSKNQNLRKY